MEADDVDEDEDVLFDCDDDCDVDVDEEESVDEPELESELEPEVDSEFDEPDSVDDFAPCCELFELLPLPERESFR